jgi:type IV pilus assembly protein PilO
MNNHSAALWRERLSSLLTWHYVGLAVMILLVAGLGARLGMDWAATNSRSTGALAGKQFELKALKMETAPLRGLDKRVALSREQMKDFYAQRIPANYSSIATEIGDLEVKSGVRLSRVQYAQGPAGTDLTEITMDAGISGEYPQIMRFVNGLERDRTFFVIRAMALTGQQGGMVNLRLRVSTWLRAADAASSGLPKAQSEDEGSSAGPGKEGE